MIIWKPAPHPKPGFESIDGMLWNASIVTTHRDSNDPYIAISAEISVFWALRQNCVISQRCAWYHIHLANSAAASSQGETQWEAVGGHVLFCRETLSWLLVLCYYLQHGWSPYASLDKVVPNRTIMQRIRHLVTNRMYRVRVLRIYFYGFLKSIYGHGLFFYEPPENETGIVWKSMTSAFKRCQSRLQALRKNTIRVLMLTEKP